MQIGKIGSLASLATDPTETRAIPNGPPESRLSDLTAGTVPIRQQARIRDAYVTIQLYISKWENYARWRTSPFRRTDPTPHLPEVSDEASAVADLMASSAVITAMHDFMANLDAFQISGGALESAQETGVPPLTGYFDDLKSAATDLIASSERVYEQMREELA
jgi:hypothetical protein